MNLRRATKSRTENMPNRTDSLTTSDSRYPSQLIIPEETGPGPAWSCTPTPAAYATFY